MSVIQSLQIIQRGWQHIFLELSNFVCRPFRFVSCSITIKTVKMSRPSLQQPIHTLWFHWVYKHLENKPLTLDKILVTSHISPAPALCSAVLHQLLWVSLPLPVSPPSSWLRLRHQRSEPETDASLIKYVSYNLVIKVKIVDF